MANKKKQDEALAAVQAQTEENGLSAAQSGYSAAGLGSRCGGGKCTGKCQL